MQHINHFSTRGAIVIACFSITLITLLSGHSALAFRDAKAFPNPQTLPDQKYLIQVDNMEREYYVHLPPSYDRENPIPLVLNFHGGGGQASGVNTLTGMNRCADRNGFMVVYPGGIDKHWQDGRKINLKVGVDDTKFVRQLIDYLLKNFKVDPQQIYACGISNGGFFSQRLAYDLNDKLAAVGSVAANTSEALAAFPPPTNPLPIVFILGTDDPLVPWQGGQVTLPWLHGASKNRGAVLSASDTINHWLTLNKCSKRAEIKALPDRSPNDGTSVTKYFYPASAEGADVLLYKVLAGGHCWPGGLQYLPARVIGKTNRDVNANDLLWQFFKQHRKTSVTKDIQAKSTK
ncbi:MAG: hypothetical protein K2W82_07170 [Candidatus Obscuribacterales bacterium]|nr:hypothetical protein [Candidatus Obscuribacterales bacterium]